jgi:hypothetical protein
MFDIDASTTSLDAARLRAAITPERADRIHQALAMAADGMDEAAGDVTELAAAAEAGAADVAPVTERDIGRAFLLARDALETARLIERHADVLLRSAERAFYATAGTMTAGQHLAYSERMSAWFAAEAGAFRLPHDRRQA